jgi:hypothetical protein
MSIEDAFTAEAIGHAGVELDDSEEDEVRDMIRKIYATFERDVEMNDDELRAHQNVGLLCFVAGRAYETTVPISVPMSHETLGDFLAFLSNRGEA